MIDNKHWITFIMNKIFIFFPILSLIVLGLVGSSFEIQSNVYSFFSIFTPLVLTGIWAIWFYQVKK